MGRCHGASGRCGPGHDHCRSCSRSSNIEGARLSAMSQALQLHRLVLCQEEGRGHK